MNSTPFPAPRRARPIGIALRAMLAAALLATSLAPRAADSLFAEPFSAAASALRSVLGDTAKSAASSAASAATAAASGAAAKVINRAAAGASAGASATGPASAPAPGAPPASSPAAGSTASEPARTASAPPLVAATPVASAASPAALLPTASPLSASTCMRATDRGAACPPARSPLSLIPVGLSTARVGVPYKPRRMFTGGVAPYTIAITEGGLPAGIAFSSDGALGGLPAGPAGLHTFTVQVTDTSVPPQSLRQAYALRVEAPPVPRKAVEPAPPPAAASAPGPAQITSYMLLQEDLDDMFPKTPAKPADAASAPEAAASAPPRQRVRPKALAQPVPYADKMHAMLSPLLNTDYPTLELYVSALEARRCDHFQLLVMEAAKAAARQATAAELRCPLLPVAMATAALPASSPASTAAPLPAPLPLPPTLYADLLPEPVKRDLIARAEWPHRLSEAQPLSWQDDGCGCAPAHYQELTYGFYPFWQARTKDKKPEPQQIQFNLFERIGYLGAQIADSGEVLTTGTLDSGHADFIRLARRHGTHMDLVLHRSDWPRLLALPNTEEILDRAVQGTLAVIDAPLSDTATRLKHHLLPFWDEPTRLFDGVTLFFDNGPTDAAGREKFRLFYRGFVHKLVAAMQKRGHSYAINIVVPDSQLGDDGAYGFEQLMGYLRLAERPDNPRLPEGAEPEDYAGSTDITVGILVWMREPTGDSKRLLRARIDDTEVIVGHRRVAFLNAVAPILFHAGGVPDGTPPGSADPAQLDADLAYFKWQYGGVGFLPMPLSGNETGQRLTRVFAKNYLPAHPSPVAGLCRVVCPNRSSVRLLFMGLLVTGVVALGLYTWVCSVRRLGRGFVAFLWAGGILTLCVGLSLLGCDPQLATLREGNIPLLTLLVVTVAVGMYYSLKPRVAPP